MAPAQQGLEARDGSILEPHDRLEMHLQLVALDGAAKVGLERDPIRPHGAHGGAEHARCGRLPRALRMGHGDLGVLQHRLALGVHARIEGREAGRAGEGDLVIPERDGGRERPAQRVGERPSRHRAAAPT